MEQCLGVQEVSDGRAATMLQEVDKQLSKLRQTANELQMPLTGHSH